MWGSWELKRKFRLILVPVFVFLTCFFSFVARHRFIDGDEGFYLLASRLVLEHKMPYLDFFYQQAPLLPYVYAFWIKFIGVSWISARMFSGLLTTLLGLLIYQHVCRETQKWIAGVAAVILFASSTLVFAWLPIVKTYSLAVLFLFCAYAIIARLFATTPGWLIAVAGVLFGLSVDTRSYIIALAPIFLWWIFRHSEARNRIARILWFLGGFTIGIVPSFCLFVAFPDLFLFNNLTYHAIRSRAGLIGAWEWKLHIARMVLLDAKNNGVQFSILLAVSFVAILALRIRRGATLLAFLIAFLLGCVSILPTPPFVQYFCVCMPFLIVTAVCGASNYVASLRAARLPKQIAVLATVAVLAAFVASSIPSFRRYLVTGEGVVGIKDVHDAPNWTLDKVSAVSRAIDQLAAPNEEIASFWPGYILESKAEPYPGFENNFGLGVAGKLMPEERARYHLISLDEIQDDFATHSPRVAVVGNQESFYHSLRVPACKAILRANGYTAVRVIGGTSIYVCCSRQ